MSALLGNRQALGAAKATSGRQQAMVMPALPARAVGQSKTLWGSSNRYVAVGGCFDWRIFVQVLSEGGGKVKAALSLNVTPCCPCRQQASVASHITHAIAPPASKGAPAAQAVQRQTKVKMVSLPWIGLDLLVWHLRPIAAAMRVLVVLVPAGTS